QRQDGRDQGGLSQRDQGDHRRGGEHPLRIVDSDDGRHSRDIWQGAETALFRRHAGSDVGMTSNGDSAVGISEEDAERLRVRGALSRKKRREREGAGEIRELNIVAMMDMMTIILVFLLKSYSASSVSVTASEDVRPPISTTRSTPHDTVAVTITPKSILVGDRKVVELTANTIPRRYLDGRR